MTDPELLDLDDAKYVIEALNERIDDLENALQWIRFVAGMHYIGGAFMPYHMRALANLATEALANDEDRKPLPNFEETQEAAKIKAEQLIKELGIDE